MSQYNYQAELELSIVLMQGALRSAARDLRKQAEMYTITGSPIKARTLIDKASDLESVANAAPKPPRTRKPDSPDGLEK